MRARLAVLVALAVAVLIAVLGVTAISVSGAGHEAEVRIAAQRLADGRTEFALQQREADGGWSERLLPRGRFSPATVGRWLSSTPLTVRGPGGGDAEGTEVRITAQRLADGRTEFALRERDADAGWGERLLTGERFFPATATVGRWLSSTPLTVSLPEPQVSEDTSDDGSVASDRAALVALYNATGGASWITRTNWLSDRALDEWHGVITNSDGRVAELWLWGNKLRGSIPAELGDLTELQTLDLRSNQLTGSIPAWLGDLTNLRRLYLGSNRLAGPIPAELGALTNLEGLLLGINQLTGPIPTELGALTNLELLILHRNELSGPIPAGLGDLTNLESLRLSDNQLTGCVLVGLRDVASNDLGELALPDCGEVSPDTAEDGGSVASDRAALVALYNATGGASWVTSTKWLTDRPFDEWHGVITNSDGRVAELALFTNQLTGPIPAELGELTDLRIAGPPVQPVDGPDPGGAGQPHQPGTLWLSNNQLTGPIPAELGALTNLESLSLFEQPVDGADPGRAGRAQPICKRCGCGATS